MKKRNKKHFPSLALGPVFIASQWIASCSHTDMQMHSEDATHTITASTGTNIAPREEEVPIFQSLCEAIRDQNNEAFKKILDEHPDLIHKVTEKDLKSSIASFLSFKYKSSLLNEADEDKYENNILSYSKDSPYPLDLLYLAVNANNEQAVRIILNRGKPCKYIDRALIHAIEWNCTDMVKLLLKAQANPSTQLLITTSKNHRDVYVTPLYMAAHVRSKEICKILLDHGANPNDIAGIEKLMPIHVAAMAEDIELTKLLISHGSTTGESVTDHATPLYHFVTIGNEEVIQLLLDNGADLSRKYDDKTLFAIAVEFGHAKLMNLLVKNKEDIYVKNYVEDKEGNTLLHLAVESNNKESLELLLHTLDATVTARLISQRNKEGETPLHKFITHLIRRGYTLKDSNILDLLIKYGANIHETYEHHTPFYRAVRSFNKGLAEVAFKFLEIYRKANLSIEEVVVTFMEEQLMKSSLMNSDYFNKPDARNRLIAFRAALLLHDDEGAFFPSKLPPIDLKTTVYEHLINKHWMPTRISNIVDQNPFYGNDTYFKNDFTTQEIADLCSIAITEKNCYSLCLYCPMAMIMPFSVVPPSEFIDRLNLLFEQLPQPTNNDYNKDLSFLSRLMDYLSSYVREHQKEEWRVDICGLSILRYCHKHNQKITWPMSENFKKIGERYDKYFKDAPSLTPYKKSFCHDFYYAFNHYWNEVNYPQEEYNQRMAKHCLSDTVAPSKADVLQEVHNALGEPLFEQLCDFIKQLKCQ